MKQNKTLSHGLENIKKRFEENNRLERAEQIKAFVQKMQDEGIADVALKPDDIAPDFTLKNATGKEFNLYKRLANGPVILTWYRGGWCPYCNLTLNYLQQYLNEFKSYGTQLIAISPEKPDQSLSTMEKNGLEFEVLTDEINEVAEKYAGVHSLPKEIHEFYAERGVGEYYKDYKTIEFPIPATYIIDRDGIIRFAFAEADYRKRAEPVEILESLKRL
jgi:peroxiredoxin